MGNSEEAAQKRGQLEAQGGCGRKTLK